jgi:multidrug efflux pump subunit AcrB
LREATLLDRRTVSASIVWGLTFSTVLTLFAIPVPYRFFMRKRTGGRAERASG